LEIEICEFTIKLLYDRGIHGIGVTEVVAVERLAPVSKDTDQSPLANSSDARSSIKNAVTTQRIQGKGVVILTAPAAASMKRAARRPLES
jgi:hypothetical protein